jgi:hypothetical protein
MDIKKKLELYLKDNLDEPTKRNAFFKKKMSMNSLGASARCSEVMDMCEEASCFSAPNINTFINNELNENKFQKLLFNYIDSKGLKDSDVYNKANIDRRLFSKIRSDDNYHPSKETIISLATSLELSIEELEELLESASYSLPKNNKFDLIIRFCFLEKIYNIIDINNLLHEHKCNLL